MGYFIRYIRFHTKVLSDLEKHILIVKQMCRIHMTASVAQWIRHRPPKPGIACSSPVGGIFVTVRENNKTFGSLRDRYAFHN